MLDKHEMLVFKKFGKTYEIKFVKFCESSAKPTSNVLRKNHQRVIEELTCDLDRLVVSRNEKTQTGPVIKVRDLVQKELATAKPNLENRGVAKCYRNTSTFKYESSKNVLIVGTSISDQSLDVDEIQMLMQECQFERIKCFTILREDGTINSELNLEEMLPVQVKAKRYDIIVIEIGCNEASIMVSI